LSPRQNAGAEIAKLKPAATILGVLCPEAAEGVDRQILALEESFDRQALDAPIIVLGRCSNELGMMSKGRIFVTNVIGVDEYERALQQYRITHLISPYRTRHFGLVDRLSVAFGLPKGYFDWSFGALDREAGDLGLDPRICFERAALEICAWINDRPIGAGDSAPLTISPTRIVGSTRIKIPPDGHGGA
jgi:hypothetical protein